MKGKLVIFSSPSGAGKTTIVKHLLHSIPGLGFSVSATTRKKRSGEENGREYFFLTHKDFARRIEAGEFLEWEEVYKGLFYGTLRSEVDGLLRTGNHVIFDVDVKGALRIKRVYGSRALAVFVMPPSLTHLEQRLKGRGTETTATLKERLKRAEEEMTYAGKFDTVVVNDRLEDALKEAEGKMRRFLGLKKKA